MRPRTERRADEAIGFDWVVLLRTVNSSPLAARPLAAAHLATGPLLGIVCVRAWATGEWRLRGRARDPGD